MKKVIISILLLLFPCGISFTQNTNEMINTQVAKYITKLKTSNEEQLMELLKRGSKSMRISAIKALGDSKNKRSKDVLTAIMSSVWNPSLLNNIIKKYPSMKKANISFDDETRAESAISLSKLNDKQTIKYIGNTLNADQSSIVRQSCAKALGILKDKEALVYLNKTVKYELKLKKNTIDNELLKKCAKAIGEIGHKDGFFTLVEISQNEKLDYKTRKTALSSLEKVKWE